MTDPVVRDIFAECVEGFLEPLSAELSDPDVSEIMVNGPHKTYVERNGRIEESAGIFQSSQQLLSCLRAVGQYLGHPLDDEHPILEGRLPDGSRLQAILAPIADGGPAFAIRRHRTDTVTLEQLVTWDALTEQAVGTLRQMTLGKKNLLVSGGTGSGKTSLLRCLSGLIPLAERIVAIEDARELHLRHPHVVSLEARPHSGTGGSGISIGELFRATLRLRPDRIVIGELRGAEALDLIQAMTSGHGGCMSTVHASSPGDALRRLETLALYRGLQLPLSALRSQIASAIDVVVQVERTASGRRWVSHITEVLALDEHGNYQLRDLYVRESEGQLIQNSMGGTYLG